MNKIPACELTNETTRLLSELEQALDHCSTIRTIARHREQLYDLESLTGPSPRTRTLRAEIRQLEQRLGAEREAAAALPGTSLLPA
jgi:hypothetical protein